jgi:hypothetical protein
MSLLVVSFLSLSLLLVHRSSGVVYLTHASTSFFQVEDADKFHDDTENMSTKFTVGPVGIPDTAQAVRKSVDIADLYDQSAGLAGTDIEMQTLHQSNSVDDIKEDYMKDDEGHLAAYPVSSGSTKVGTLSRSSEGQLHPTETRHLEQLLMLN